MKLVAILLTASAILFSAASLAADGPFSGKSKTEYFTEIESIMKSEDSKKSAPGTKQVKDWGQCRDTCYNQRNQCYDMGGNSYHCEAIYDACTARCDERY